MRRGDRVAVPGGRTACGNRDRHARNLHPAKAAVVGRSAVEFGGRRAASAAGAHGRGGGLAEALADGAVRTAMASSFGTYAVFVLLGYLKDVEADRATRYNTVAVRFGRRAAVVWSASFAALGLAASGWLVQPRLTVSAGIALWSVGAVMLVGAHVLAWRSMTDNDAWPGIQTSVHGFVAVHLGEAAAIEPRWTLMAWILFGASIVAMFRRPVLRQV